MDQSPVRYAALAFVIAGGLMISGPGAVALADDPSGDGDNNGGTTTVDSGGTQPAAATPLARRLASPRLRCCAG